MKTKLILILAISFYFNNSFSQNVEDFKLYPNPFVESINFQFKLVEKDTVSFTIYNRFGQIEKKLIDNIFFPAGYYESKYSCFNLDEGVYFLKISGNKGDSAIYNLIKKDTNNYSDSTDSFIITHFETVKTETKTIKTTYTTINGIITATTIDTVTINNTTTKTITDTITIYDTLNKTIIDTISFFDTLTIEVYDTIGIEIDGFEIVTSIEEQIKNAGISIYPTPATDIINIEHSEIIIKLEILNIKGVIIYSYNPNNSFTQISINESIKKHKGIVFFKIYDAKDKEMTIKSTLF